MQPHFGLQCCATSHIDSLCTPVGEAGGATKLEITVRFDCTYRLENKKTGQHVGESTDISLFSKTVTTNQH